MLKNLYIALVEKYTSDKKLIEKLWSEIEANYSQNTRFYHNLWHIESVINELLFVKNYIADFDTILFSAFYHDIVYDANKHDNEEQSALFAEKILKRLNIEQSVVEKCKEQILSTKTHESTNNDTLFLLDADLSILGQIESKYTEYQQNIRKEYSVFSNEQYRKGRKKVVEFFLVKKQIYKTDFFINKYENIARSNLKNELRSLNNN